LLRIWAFLRERYIPHKRHVVMIDWTDGASILAEMKHMKPTHTSTPSDSCGNYRLRNWSFAQLKSREIGKLCFAALLHAETT
jgi:hypothetical protein